MARSSTEEPRPERDAGPEERIPPGLELRERGGLPDALRTLVEALPRGDWAGHPNFGGLTQFWLERHAMFRELVRRIGQDTETFLDAGIDPAGYATRLSRLGGALIAELHGHHRIEDAHYFPALRAVEPGLAVGFELLDRDHLTLDRDIHGLTESINQVLGDLDLAANAGRLRETLTGFEQSLNRHLVDEEEIIVPILLRHGGG